MEARRAERATRFGATLRPEDVRVLHEDADAGVLVVLKPAGAYVEDVHEALRRSRADATLTLPHRLDRDTSGCLALATTPEANRSLARAFREGDVGKTYVARCLPRATRPRPPSRRRRVGGGANGPRPRRARPVARLRPRGRRAALPGRKPSVVKAMATRLLVLNDAAEAEERPARSPRFIVAEPATGRTHQIRLHCAHVGLSLEGDVKYGGRGAAEAATRTRTRTRTRTTRGGSGCTRRGSSSRRRAEAPPSSSRRHPRGGRTDSPRRTLGRAEERRGRRGEGGANRTGGGMRAFKGNNAACARRWCRAQYRVAPGTIASTSVPRARRHDAPDPPPASPRGPPPPALSSPGPSLLVALAPRPPKPRSASPSPSPPPPPAS